MLPAASSFQASRRGRHALIKSVPYTVIGVLTEKKQNSNTMAR